MDKNEALAIFGISENASIDDINKKYSILLKKYKSKIDSGIEEEELKTEFEKINTAYNILMGYETEQYDNQENEQEGKPFSKKKLENFYYYNKYKMLAALFLIVLFGVIGKSFIDRPKNDISVSFVGNIYSLEVEPLKQNIRDNTEKIKSPRIDMSTLPHPVQNEFQLSVRERVTVNMALGAIDVCILDLPYLEEYCSLGVFMPLDEALEECNADLEKNKPYYVKGKNDESEKLYGIDVSNSRILKDSNIKGETMIFAILNNTEKYDICVELLRILLQ